MKVSIIGAGNMARGIGTRVLAGGNDVELIARNPAAAQELADELGATVSDQITGDAVVLAVPYPAAAEVIAEHGDELRGKVVVDITNPVDWATFEGLVTPADSSAAEEIAKLLPQGANVVKAFNTTFASTLSSGEVAGQTLDVLLAGDDADAKATVASFVEAGGLRPLDVGPAPARPPARAARVPQHGRAGAARCRLRQRAQVPLVEGLPPELLLDARVDLGEGPIWHPRRGALSWVEIFDGRVNWLELDGSAGESVEVGRRVGAAVPADRRHARPRNRRGLRAYRP